MATKFSHGHLKITTLGRDSHYFTALNHVQIHMSTSDLFDALTAGTIDAVATDYLSLISHLVSWSPLYIFDTATGQLSLDGVLVPQVIYVPEFLIGDAGNNEIEAHEGNDTLEGRGGNDTLIGNRGDDALNGGEGIDTAKYIGDSNHFTIQITKGAATKVIDRKGAEGTDSLQDVEKLDFAVGKDVNLSDMADVANIDPTSLMSLIEMYIAYFNRAPDAEGLFYWGTRLSQGMSLQDIAQSFSSQNETVFLHSSTIETGYFVNTAYNNVLGRSADTEGFNYWVGQLDGGRVQKGEFLLAMVNGAKASTGSAEDAAYIKGKADIGVYFSVIKGMSHVHHSKTAMWAYDGTDAGTLAAKNSVDVSYYFATTTDIGELLIQLVGVLDDPFG